jgi:predicted Zn finger-like uncharacterized protein
MKITCQACGAKYTIADDKVRGRKVKIRCKGCSAPIVVDAQQGEAEGGAIEAAGAPEMAGADAGLEVADQSSPPPAGDGWSVNLSDSDQRNMTTEEIVAGYASGLVTADAFVWKDGMADWVPVLECAELAALLKAPSAPKAEPARLAGGRSAGAVDLFGSVATAGSEEEEVATSAPAVGPGALPQAGSTAYDDGKLTGARNENSVLFSLDALKAGGPAEAPKKSAPTKPGAPPRKGAAAAQSSSDPFGMGGSNDLMNIGGGGSPLFSLNANQALLTAPAPPEPPPSRSTDMNVSSGSIPRSMPAPKKNKTLLIGGGVAALLLVAIAGFAFSGDKKEEASAEIASASAAAATAEAPKTEEKVEEKKEEPKSEEKKEEPKSEASAAPSAAAAPTAAEAAKVGPGTPNKGSSGPAPKKEEPAPVAAGPFNKSAAVAQLTSASNSAQSCKKGGGPTGSGKVQVTFAPSGRVTSATVQGGPFAGTPTGGCVASLFRRAKVPPFSGDAITVSKSFMIN